MGLGHGEATVVGYLGHELVRVEMLGSGVSRLERLRGIIAALVGGKAQGPKCGEKKGGLLSKKKTRFQYINVIEK